jgi:hypothetical protein
VAFFRLYQPSGQPKEAMTATATQKTISAKITEGLATGTRVDRTSGVIRGVKLIGFESRNNRIYPAKVLKEAVHLYEGAKVNIDHPERGPGQERKYSDRFGAIKNVRFVENQGLYGDFHFNPHHPMTEQVLWDAENNPEALGFSHNATLRLGKPQGGKEVIESIIQIRSMDLVADPATTTSLFESENMDEMPSAPAATETDPKAAMKGAFRQMIMAAVDDESLDMRSTIKKISEIMKSQEKLMGGGSSAPEDEAEEAYEKDGKKMAEESYKQTIASLTQRLESYEAKEKQAQRLESINTELTKAGLNPKDSRHVSELFSKQLLATESETDRAELIKDRAALVGTTRRTESQGPVYTPATTQVTESIDAKTFARRLLG